MRHIILAGAALALAGCATKQYPIATPVSSRSAALMSCEDLAIELVKTEEMQWQIAGTASTDWRSIAGYMADFGIGNAMAKSEADKALAARRASIITAQGNQGCLTHNNLR